MTNRVATFMKVSETQFLMDACGISPENAQKLADLRKESGTPALYYDDIKLPCRATTGSAGYDFYMPFPVTITATPKLVHTGIRVRLDKGWMLALFPRSGFGFKYGMRLINTVGIIDSDYFNAKNEGHIAAKLVADEPVELKTGDRFMQGILLPYGVATNDHILMAQREGGMGSTGSA